MNDDHDLDCPTCKEPTYIEDMHKGDVYECYECANDRDEFCGTWE